MKVNLAAHSIIVAGTFLSCLGQRVDEKIELFGDVWKCHEFLENGLIYVNSDVNSTYSSQGIAYQLCDMEILSTSVSCLRNVSRKWSFNPTQMAVLQNIASPISWEKVISKFCKDLPEYTNDDQCVNGLRATITSCLTVNRAEFNNKVAQLTPGEVDKIMLTMCLYYEGNRRCTVNPIKDKCKTDLGNVLGELIRTYMPIMCRRPSSVGPLLMMPSESDFLQGLYYLYMFVISLTTYTLGKL